MEKLTGHGRPHPHFVGEVGQHYEDLDTGDLYECRIAKQFSPTHGWPVGGYVWERRAKGEDISDLYGSGGNGPQFFPVYIISDPETGLGKANATAEEIVDAWFGDGKMPVFMFDNSRFYFTKSLNHDIAIFFSFEQSENGVGVLIASVYKSGDVDITYYDIPCEMGLMYSTIPAPQ